MYLESTYSVNWNFFQDKFINQWLVRKIQLSCYMRKNYISKGCVCKFATLPNKCYRAQLSIVCTSVQMQWVGAWFHDVPHCTDCGKIKSASILINTPRHRRVPTYMPFVHPAIHPPTLYVRECASMCVCVVATLNFEHGSIIYPLAKDSSVKSVPLIMCSFGLKTV